jgi:hypothetical protein
VRMRDGGMDGEFWDDMMIEKSFDICLLVELELGNGLVSVVRMADLKIHLLCDLSPARFIPGRTVVEAEQMLLNR